MSSSRPQALVSGSQANIKKHEKLGQQNGGGDGTRFLSLA
jgi:hypothetical protein